MKSISIKFSGIAQIRLVVAVILLSFFFIYQNTISKTISLYQNNTVLREELLNAQNANSDIRILKSKVILLESKLKKFSNSKEVNHEQVLDKVTELSRTYHLTLKDFPTPFIEQTEDFLVEISKVTVEGTFNNVLSFIYDLENHSKVGKPASIEFNTYNVYTKNKKLFCTIYLQNIRKKSI